jgi:purine nucleoside permease
LPARHPSLEIADDFSLITHERAAAVNLSVTQAEEGGSSMPNIFEAPFATTKYLLTGASILAGFAAPAQADHGGRPVKIMIINMFGGPAPSEASAFTGNLHLTEAIPVRGLSPDYPNILCNSDDVCQMIAGEGHANVAASTMALTLSDKFDLRNTYFLIAGIAGIDPHQGTTGSAAWARYLVDYGISWEIDAREIPGTAADPSAPPWPYGYLAIFPTDTTTQPWNSLPSLPTPYHSEMYQLNEALLQKILSLTSNVDLTVNDTPAAQAYRGHYTEAKATAPITSSARSRIDCGTVRPSALAVLRFTSNSNLVGNCTGRSSNFVPRRMRST